MAIYGNALPSQTGHAGEFLTTDGSVASWAANASGTVTSVSVVTANGVSGTVATATTTPAITLTLGAITPTSIKTPLIFPASDSTDAIDITKADGTTKIVQIDTTNRRVGLGATSIIGGPAFILHLAEAGSSSAVDVVQRLENYSTATANGMGVGVDFVLSTDGPTRTITGQIASVWSDKADANRAADLVFYTKVSGGANTERLRLVATGAINMPGLGTSSAATTGTVCWTTGTGLINVDTTTTCLLSSAKYKERSRALNLGLDAVLKLRPVSYFLKDDFNKTGLGEQIGLFAEDVAQVDERLVSLEDDGSPHAVRYQQLTAVLAGAIQEQHAQYSALESRFNTLWDQVNL